jgi:hypothetical protein
MRAEPLYHRAREKILVALSIWRRPVRLEGRRDTMQYMLLIYDNEKLWPQMSEAESKKYMGEYFAFTEELKQAGKLIAGDALQPTAKATTVRVRDGKRLTTDGPFAETKEQLGGYYLIEAKDLDEALAYAAKIPSARLGSIEVRPVMKFD